MPRNLNAAEKQRAKQVWPRMNVDTVLVTAEATSQYNCLAWTLGITSSWVWPWGSRNATKSEFDALYRGYGYQPGGNGTIAAWGLNLNSMTHGSIFSYPYNKWESKCGALFRIIHTLPEMEGGSLYGNVQYYYSRRTALKEMVEKMAKDFNEQNALTKQEEEALNKATSAIDATLRSEFNEKYEKWKATWEHPLIIVSSNPVDRTNTIEFLELISMGKVILPLLMEKLHYPDEFFALQAVDKLLDESLIIKRDLEDEANLMGEQGRALETIKRWVEYNL